MRLQDALFNWLQIRIVAENRPDDNAASETREFFEEILREDHGMTYIDVSVDETMIHIHYQKDGAPNKMRFDRELAEQLLRDIEANPKYN